MHRNEIPRIGCSPRFRNAKVERPERVSRVIPFSSGAKNLNKEVCKRRHARNCFQLLLLGRANEMVKISARNTEVLDIIFLTSL